MEHSCATDAPDMVEFKYEAKTTEIESHQFNIPSVKIISMFNFFVLLVCVKEWLDMRNWSDIYRDICPRCPLHKMISVFFSLFHGSLLQRLETIPPLWQSAVSNCCSLLPGSPNPHSTYRNCKAGDCRCYTTQWNSCYTYCNLIVDCLLWEQHTQLEALVLGGRVTAQT